MLDSPLRWSPTRNLLWKIRDSYLAKKLLALASVVFTKEREQGRAFATAGPPQLYRSEKERYPQLAELWANGSRQLNYLCRANRIAYVHVLQPNQYVPNSKSIGPLEMSVAYRDDNCYASGVKDGYPELLRRGKIAGRRRRLSRPDAALRRFCRSDLRRHVLPLQPEGERPLGRGGGRSPVGQPRARLALTVDRV